MSNEREEKIQANREKAQAIREARKEAREKQKAKEVLSETPVTPEEVTQPEKVSNLEVVGEQEVISENISESQGETTEPNNLKSEVEKEDSLSQEERAIIRQQRARKQIIDKCTEEVTEVLKKHRCALRVNPNSPIGAPQIIVALAN